MRKIILSTIACLCMFSGCTIDQFKTIEPKTLTQAEMADKIQNELAVFQDIRDCYLKGVEKANIYGLSFPNSYLADYPDISLSFPFIYGAKLDMDQEHYMIRRYSKRVLLFPNYGIKDKFNIMYSSLDAKERMLNKMKLSGYDELFLKIFDKLSSYPIKESYDFIVELEKLGVVESDEVLNFNLVESRNETYIKKLFSNYFDFEYDLFQNKDVDEALDHWTLEINDKTLTLDKNDFKMYSLTDFIVRKVLSSGKIISI